MASLVHALAAGIRGAESGSVEFYQVGTSITASAYSDVNAETAETTHALDANGGIARYVTEPVDVVVKDSTGATVRTFTHIEDARVVRVENDGFTGPNSTGQTVAGGRTTADGVFSLLFESLGATNGYVDVGNADQLIQEAIGSSTGVFFNVKTGYGAKGDGVNDDTAAIQSAIVAAQNSSLETCGIIYFPPGTYKIAGTIYLWTGAGNTSVMFLGCGPNKSVIQQSSSGVSGWISDYDGFTQGGDVSFMGLQFAPTTTGKTGTMFLSDGRLRFVNCHLGAFNGTMFTLTSGTDVACTNCAFTHSEASSAIGTGTGTIRISNSKFTVSSINPLFQDSTAKYFLSNCDVQSSIASAVIFYNTYGSFVGGQVKSTAGSGTTIIMKSMSSGTISGAYLESGSAAMCVMQSGTVNESGCTFASSNVVYGANFSGGHSTSRDFSVTASNVNGTSYTPDSMFGMHEVTHTAGAGMAFNNPTLAPTSAGGHPLTILYKNTTGSPVTPTFGANYNYTATIGAVANNKACIYRFISSGTISSGKWVMIENGSSATVTTGDFTP